MKITFESYWKRAAVALRKKELDIPTNCSITKSQIKKADNITQTNIIISPTENKLVETYKNNLTNALSKVQRYPAASVKSWQGYNDTGMGIRWSRRSMVKLICSKFYSTNISNINFCK